MAEPIASLIVRILADTSEMVSGMKKGSVELDGFQNRVDNVTKSVVQWAEESGHGGVAVGSLTSTYRQFDGVLQSVGINIGPQVKGLEDLALAAGKSATQIGAVGTAGLALGAGIGGWAIGRAIADFFDLDKAIAQAATSLLGYGDLMAETAGAKQDVINRAFAAGASGLISYKDAIKFLNDEAQRNIDKNINWAETLAIAKFELHDLTESRKKDIQIAIDADATTEQLTHDFGLSALALKLLTAEHREAAAAASAQKRETEALSMAYDKLISDIKNANQMAIFDKDADTERRRQENSRQLGLMDRDAGLIANRKAFDDREAVEAERLAWERRFFAEQDRLDRELQQLMRAQVSRTVATGNPGGFASVVNPVSSSIVINAQNSFFNNPESLNQLARLVEDAIARRFGLSGQYSRR